ncbi:hypothetical protein [Cystobacter fuscus]|uniref:hypothetical protein n=1 Tax=Cystobacter fuscus TaxID=43 RepID=UPI000BB351D2|nr:hypothetical protein [Cystobacter fuscus]
MSRQNEVEHLPPCLRRERIRRRLHFPLPHHRCEGLLAEAQEMGHPAACSAWCRKAARPRQEQALALVQEKPW